MTARRSSSCLPTITFSTLAMMRSAVERGSSTSSLLARPGLKGSRAPGQARNGSRVMFQVYQTTYAAELPAVCAPAYGLGERSSAARTGARLGWHLEHLADLELGQRGDAPAIGGGEVAEADAKLARDHTGGIARLDGVRLAAGGRRGCLCADCRRAGRDRSGAGGSEGAGCCGCAARRGRWYANHLPDGQVTGIEARVVGIECRQRDAQFLCDSRQRIALLNRVGGRRGVE